MAVVSFVNTKGGVGKTCSTMFLAAAAHYAGHKVTIIDSDPQGTASSWFHDAQENPETRLDNCELVIANQGTMQRAAQRDGLVFIDTPPGNYSTVDSAIEVADFVVIPTLPSTIDMERVWKTRAAIPDGKPAAVLLTAVNAQTVLYREVREALESYEVAVFPQYIPHRDFFRQMRGQWPVNDARQMLGYEHVLDQILEVMK